MQGTGDKSTQTFTAGGDWDLAWSYDCTAGLTRGGSIPSGYHCAFIVHVRTADGRIASADQGVTQLGVKDSSVQHFHSGGTFYLEVSLCCAEGQWTVTATTGGS